jgi:TetR/AcrR family tetracycline transcriptional repressor
VNERQEKARLHRDEIIGVALTLLDELGMEQMSLRRLASRLGITAPTLYWHFSSRQDLYDAMAAQVVSRAPRPDTMPEGTPWQEQLRWLGRSAREAMLSIRDGALLVSLSQATSRQWEDVNVMVRRLEVAGLTPRQSMVGLATVMSYVVGAAMEEQQRTARSGPMGGMDPRATPMVALAAMGATDPTWRFEEGLNLIVGGLAAQVG